MIFYYFFFFITGSIGFLGFVYFCVDSILYKIFFTFWVFYWFLPGLWIYFYKLYKVIKWFFDRHNRGEGDCNLIQKESEFFTLKQKALECREEADTLNYFNHLDKTSSERDFFLQKKAEMLENIVNQKGETLNVLLNGDIMQFYNDLLETTYNLMNISPPHLSTNVLMVGTLTYIFMPLALKGMYYCW